MELCWESDGSSETALDALTAELQKMGKSGSDITHIVSSTSEHSASLIILEWKTTRNYC